ncbi:MAG: ABC transporter ATP-binding protein [Zavarzinella sp.]
MSAVAEFHQVTKIFRSGLLGKQRHTALDNVTLQIPVGMVTGLLGPNRAGKTTLIKILLRLNSPTSGKVVRLGHDASYQNTLAQVGYVHENQYFPKYLSAKELLTYYGSLTYLPPMELKAKIPQLLNKVGLADRADEQIRKFSKGMVQRLAIAQAIMNDPELLVLDEPSEGLDISGKAVLRDVIQERKSLGKSVICVSHNMEEMSKVADFIVVLKNGRVISQRHLTDKDRVPGALESQLQAHFQEVPA